jgi:erythronate-4-phosphate dehydrogenase
MKIIADDKIPFLRGVLEPFAEVLYIPGNRISNTVLKEADALLTRSITACDEALLKNTAVKLIATATIGDDHIDKTYCRENNIKVATAKGCNAGAVNQYVQAVLVGLAYQKKIDLSRQTMAIIGAGNIGKQVLETAELFGMNALLNDPPREREEGPGQFVSLEEIKDKADVISLHVPLNQDGKDRTHHLLDQAFFSQLKKPVILINTSRGPVIESRALKLAIDSGRVNGLALDVWENEPLPDPELVHLADLATPHIAGYSVEGKVMGTAMTVQAVSRFFQLGINDWMPGYEKITGRLSLDCSGLNTKEVLHRVFDSVCPLQHDSHRLKQNVDAFEEQRRNYTFRAENSNYTIAVDNCGKSVTRLLSGLGFRVQQI